MQTTGAPICSEMPKQYKKGYDIKKDRTALYDPYHHGFIYPHVLITWLP